MKQRGWRLLGGFNASEPYSWKIATISTVIPTLLQILFGLTNNLIPLMVAMAASVLIANALFHGLRLAQKYLTQLRKIRTVPIFFTYGFVGFSVSTSTSYILGSSHAGPSPSVQLVIAGAIFYTWYFSIVSIFISGQAEYLDKYDLLSTTQTQIEHARKWRSENLNFDAAKVVGEIRNQIQLVQRRLVDSSTSKRNHIDQLISVLLQEIDGWDIGISTQSDRPTNQTTKRRKLRDVIKIALSTKARVEIPSSLFIATTWIVTGLTMTDWRVATLAPIAAGFVLYWGLVVVRRATNVFHTSRHSRSSKTLLLVIWFLCGVAAGILPVMLSRLPFGVLVPIGIQTTIIVALFAILLGYRIHGETLNEKLTLDIKRLEHEHIANAIAIRTLRDRIRHFIHGELQTALVSSQRSSQANHDTETEFEVDLNNALALLEKAYVSGEVLTPRKTLQDLVEIWGETIEISANWSEDLDGVLASSEISSTILSELLVEIVTNFAKHDRATRIMIYFQCDTSSILRIEAKADGFESTFQRVNPKRLSKGDKSSNSSRASGRGTELFSEVCLDWSIFRSTKETRTTLLMPILLNGSNDGI